VTVDAQRAFMRQRQEQAMQVPDEQPWLVSTWSKAEGGGQRHEWLGLADGRGGRHPKVRWLFERASVGQRGDDGVHCDSNGDWWSQLVDEDGEAVAYTTSVPSERGGIVVHALAAYRCSVPARGATVDTM
jgi:hypothetical protein